MSHSLAPPHRSALFTPPSCERLTPPSSGTGRRVLESTVVLLQLGVVTVYMGARSSFAATDPAPTLTPALTLTLTLTPQVLSSAACAIDAAPVTG